METMKRWFVLLALLVVGCAPWVRVGGVYHDSDRNFSVDLPQGWMKSGLDKRVLITRDGVLLQAIVIERLKTTDELQYTKKKLEPSMLPQEAAEVIADNISANPSITGFTVLENAPTTIATRLGFKLLYQYKNKDGLQCKGMYCGFLSGDWFYALQYTAPTRYYFDKDVGTFEKVLNSFTFIKTT
jgi:hypothetical protein